MDANAQFWLEVWKLIVTAAVTVTVGAVTAWIANNQRKIAASQRDIARTQAETAASQKAISQAKLNLDLFEQRYEVFNEVWDYLSSPVNVLRFNEEQAEFANLLPKAQFLFGADIADYMRQAYSKKSDLALKSIEIAQKLQVDVAAHVELTALEMWLSDEARDCIRRFAPYLDFSVWKAQ